MYVDAGLFVYLEDANWKKRSHSTSLLATQKSYNCRQQNTLRLAFRVQAEVACPLSKQ